MSRILQIGTATTEDPKRSDRCRRYGVKELSLFGSAARDESPVDSDIDPLVHCTPGVRIALLKFESLVEELELLTGRRVDLVTKRGLKPWVRENICANTYSKRRA